MDTRSNTSRKAMVAHLLGTLAVTGVYLSTLAPSLDRIDAGELAAVQYTGGVAHPTGYPLFTLVGWLFSRLPIGTPIWRLNLLSLLFVAGGVFLFMRALHIFLSRQPGSRPAKAQGKAAPKSVASPSPTDGLSSWGSIAGSLLGGLALAFSRTFWEQGTSIEVYSLHICLLGLLFLLLGKAWTAPADSVRPWLAVAVGLALSFANHLTTVVMLPGIAVLFFARLRFTTQAFKTLGLMLAVFFPLLILQYAWLPIRSATAPALNWGSTDSWEMFWYHVTGRQFRVWWFTGSKAFMANFKAFFEGGDKLTGVGKQFAWMGLALALAGGAAMVKRRALLLAWLLVLLATNLLYVSNYSIPDLAPYYLGCYFVVAFLLAGAVDAALRLKASPALRIALCGMAGAGIIAQVPLHHSAVDKRGLWMYEDYSRMALESLPKDAVVITFQWDHLVSEAYYLQQVEEVRPDVLLVEYEIMKDRLWYKDHLIRNAPALSASIKPQLDAFYDALEPFYLEGDEKAFPRLQQTWPRLVWAIMTEGSKTRPVFLAPEVFHERFNSPPPHKEMAMPEGYTIVPHQYFYQVVTKEQVNNYVDIPPRAKPIRMAEFAPKEDYYVGRLRYYLTVVAHDRALYELYMRKPDRAKAWKQELLRLNPTVGISPELQGI